MFVDPQLPFSSPSTTPSAHLPRPATHRKYEAAGHHTSTPSRRPPRVATHLRLGISTTFRQDRTPQSQGQPSCTKPPCRQTIITQAPRRPMPTGTTALDIELRAWSQDKPAAPQIPCHALVLAATVVCQIILNPIPPPPEPPRSSSSSAADMVSSQVLPTCKPRRRFLNLCTWPSSHPLLQDLK